MSDAIPLWDQQLRRVASAWLRRALRDTDRRQAELARAAGMEPKAVGRILRMEVTPVVGQFDS